MKLFTSVNPYNGSLIGEHEVLDDSQLQQALDDAAVAWQSWKKTSFKQRADWFRALAAVLRDTKENLARTIALEMGKVLNEGRAEIEKSARLCEFYAQHGDGFLRDETITTEARKTYVAYQPIGAVFGIMPWNYPVWQVIRAAVPAIMAGNVFLLKHAPNVMQCAKDIEAAFKEAGFPKNVFRTLVIDTDQAKKVIASDTVQGITITGSEMAGSSVAATAGKHIKKTVLELGGSDPFIVLADADLDTAARTGIQSRMQNAGQSCIAAKRFIVMEQVKEAFLNKMNELVNQLVQGDQLNEKTMMGPMARPDLAEKLELQQRLSVKHGAILISGGTRSGCNYEPTLLDQVHPGIPAFDEEMFGPIASIITAKDEQEAIRLANNNRFGLGASIWTNDLARGERLAREIQSGSVFVNALVKSDARYPFGGIKKSGYGRELSSHGIKEFTNAKTIYIK